MNAEAFRVERATRSSRIGLAILVVALALLAAAPFWAGRAELRLLAEIYAYLALASLWNLLAGYAGLVSVGQQAFVGLGAYLLFGFAILADIPPLWTIPLAGLISAAVCGTCSPGGRARRRSEPWSRTPSDRCGRRTMCG